MNRESVWTHFALLWLSLVVAPAQVVLSPSPLRVLGHTRNTLTTLNPNLVEGRELNSPQGVAIDHSSDPPALFVSDTANNRVLAWRNAQDFQNGAAADLVIGQRDFVTTFAQGPATSFTTGLNTPTGIAVHNGDLYVADTGNNRILRFRKPLTQSEQFPDFVIGQNNFTSRNPNQGQPQASETSLVLATGGAFYRAGLAFDRSGDLWVSDPGNRRVLRYPAAALEDGAGNGPAADLVLGQFDFVTSAQPPGTINIATRDQFFTPSALAFDSGGRLFVSDANSATPQGTSRILVFQPPFLNGMTAARIMGIYVAAEGETPSAEVVGRTVFLAPEGIVFLGDRPSVLDTLNHRILVFDPYDEWPSESSRFSPEARSVFGQPDFGTRGSNRRLPESGPNTLATPVGGAATPNSLFVADSGNHRVLVLPVESGEISPAVRVLGQEGFQLNSVNRVEGREFDFVSSTLADSGVAVDTSSNPPHLYVADTYNNRVLGFRDARTVRPGDRADLVIGQPDMLRTQCNYPANDPDRPTDSNLCRPVGLALDAQGNLYVADAGNGRVLRFAQPFAQPQTLPRANLVLGQRSFTSKITDPSATTIGAPYGLAFAGQNGLLVSDALHSRVLFFQGNPGEFTSGQAAAKVFGQPNFTSSAAGSLDNRMNGPRHIATDTDDRLYVADTGNDRVLIFNRVTVAGSDPRAAVILTLTNNNTPLRAPRGIFVSRTTGEIWVADTSGNRVLRYPRFDDLPFTGFAPDFVMPGVAPLAVSQDAFGAVFVADAANRLALHFPGVSALNAANFVSGRALAPGMVASLYPLGIQFTEETVNYSGLPLPRELADIQVLVNDEPAPLFFVGPGQINFQVPMDAPESGFADVQVVRTSTGQILAGGAVQMNLASPGLFTTDGSGRGQVRAINQDGSINSPENPAPRGSVVTLFATGQGVVPGAPPDGEAPQGEIATPEKPRVIVNTGFVEDDDVQASVLAPDAPGTWQVKVRIPMTAPPESGILVVLLYKGIPSNNPQNPAATRTTIAVKAE
jgi:uncharacterized protein (TIGR03437 family)